MQEIFRIKSFFRRLHIYKNFTFERKKKRKKKTWPAAFINWDHWNWSYAFAFYYLFCKVSMYIVCLCYLFLQISKGRIYPVLQGSCPLAFAPPTCHWQYVKPLESCSWQDPHFSTFRSQFPRKGWQTLVTFCINTCLLKLDFFFLPGI